LKNNKLRLLRHEKEEVIEVEAPQVMAEPAVDEPEKTPVSSLYIKEINLMETSCPNSDIPVQLEFDSSSSDNYDQLKKTNP